MEKKYKFDDEIKRKRVRPLPKRKMCNINRTNGIN